MQWDTGGGTPFRSNAGGPQVICAGAGQPNGWDNRPVLRLVTAINKGLMCPFDKAVDLETQNPLSWYYSCQQMWFGWRYAGQQGMFKVGDRFTDVSPVDKKQREFSVLVSDWVSQDAASLTTP